jgi:dipeptidase
MCDTFVALGNATQDGSVIFGKNSDREPNEGHELVFIPHAEHSKNSNVDCTYIKIPQLKETNAVLLSKPFWIWGAEMGANEHGVVIGNEALFTKVPYDKTPGLIGMDFLRLALERAETADEALEIMIGLLETYGQGGDCGFAHHLYYHNGFLIADRDSAWVFETAGKHWAAEKVSDIRSISNAISIGSKWDRASDDLVNYAIEKGWCKSESDFEFGRCYSDLIYTKFSAGRQRQCRTTELLSSQRGMVDVPFAMQLLRDHGPDIADDWQPGEGLAGAEVCMHASFGPVRVSQTTGSMISHLSENGDTHWLTGTSAPCTSIFKPVWFDSGLPDLGPQPNGDYDDSTLWWRHENLHREILRDYSVRIKIIQAERDSFESQVWNSSMKLPKDSPDLKKEFTNACFEKADEHEETWLGKIRKMPIQKGRPILDKLAWKKFDREAKRVD